MSGSLRLILGDQLSDDLPSLRSAHRERDVVLLCEVMDEASYVPHHKQKIALIFTAMRRYAARLREAGWQVLYTRLDDTDNTHSLRGEVQRALQRTGATGVTLTEAGEWRLRVEQSGWQAQLGVPVQIMPDDRYLCSHEAFATWARGRKQLRMEYFYREMRAQHAILIEADGRPTGGEWNYDKENRSGPDQHLRPPKLPSWPRSSELIDVCKLVQSRFPDNFGTLDHFHWATSHSEAQAHLEHFLAHALPYFGTYQDAMLAGEPFLYHSVLSAYLNIGLLDPLTVCRRAEDAYRQGRAPLNAVEGFIRQILGWREYVRGVYWLRMPDYARSNHFDAHLPLPHFYWDAGTRMACVAEAVRHTRDHAYSHHIQRLMVTGNFALIAGISPEEVCAWYLAVYADAFEWVELPNTLGMALYGDGGLLASKPYAASGKYIEKMSNYCEHCSYRPKLSTGPQACPFNALYWDFIDRNDSRLRANPRMAYVYATWSRMDEQKKTAILQWAAQLKRSLNDL